jgi:hypothetical protein
MKHLTQHTKDLRRSELLDIIKACLEEVKDRDKQITKWGVDLSKEYTFTKHSVGLLGEDSGLDSTEETYVKKGTELTGPELELIISSMIAEGDMDDGDVARLLAEATNTTLDN